MSILQNNSLFTLRNCNPRVIFIAIYIKKDRMFSVSIYIESSIKLVTKNIMLWSRTDGEHKVKCNNMAYT